MAKSETKKNNLNILSFLLKSFIDTYKGIVTFIIYFRTTSYGKMNPPLIGYMLRLVFLVLY